MKMHGNTILITGGGSGIGRALARRFQALGNTVIVAGRNSDSLAETVGDRADMAAMTLDVADTSDVRRFAEKLIANHPSLNVLVNCAGIMRTEDAGAGRDLQDADETIATNLSGPIHLTTALIEHLKARQNAVIINITSGLAFVPLAATPTYNATKAALHSYTVTLRTVLAGKAEVIEIAPPGVQTELTPGQSKDDQYMPLDEFADEAMTLLQAQPTPAEILVERVLPLRWAERDGKFDEMVEMLASH